jgi:phosphoesterase RecJ-like protein
MDEALLRRAKTVISNAHRVLVVSHHRPDGDAVGAALGLGLALEEAGKQVQMILSDKVPLNLRHLPGADRVKNKPDGEVDLVVVLDSSDLDRIGNVLEGFGQPDVNIDHHVTNQNFARINLVDTNAVATTEILAEHLEFFGLPLTKSVGIALLTGLITDTLGFRTQNMTPKALRIAADLMDLGIDLPDLYFRALTQRTFESLKYWGAGLTRLKRDNGMVWTSLMLKDRREVGYPGRDDGDLVNVLSTVTDCDIALIFVEQKDQKVKISWRARPGFDTTKVASSFGGGGHEAASGAQIEGNIQDVQDVVLQATRTLLNVGQVWE